MIQGLYISNSPLGVTDLLRIIACTVKIASTNVTLHLPVADEQIFVRDFEAISEDGPQEIVQKQVFGSTPELSEGHDSAYRNKKAILNGCRLLPRAQ